MISNNKTFLPNQKYNNRNWFLIDCKNQKLGRLATIVTAILKGKTKVPYCPSIDSGDYVVLINIQAILINKESKHYIVNKPGRPGRSLKIKNVIDSLPKFSVERSIKRMLSNAEKKRLMRRLMIYDNQNHPHPPQMLIKMDISNYSGLWR